MSTTYKLCKLLIERGKTDGLMDKLDAYLAADRISVDEYNELAELFLKGGEEDGAGESN